MRFSGRSIEVGTRWSAPKAESDQLDSGHLHRGTPQYESLCKVRWSEQTAIHNDDDCNGHDGRHALHICQYIIACSGLHQIRIS